MANVNGSLYVVLLNCYEYIQHIFKNTLKIREFFVLLFL